MNQSIPIEKVAMMYFKVCIEREAALEQIEKLAIELKERGKNGGGTEDSEDNKS